MRMIYAVVLLGVLAASDCVAGSASKPAVTASRMSATQRSGSGKSARAVINCGVKQKVQIVYGPNPLSGAENCTIVAVRPGSVEVCDDTMKITWNISNFCDKPVLVSIGDRSRLFPSPTKLDPLVNVTALAAPVAKATSATEPGKDSINAEVRKDAEYGTYKYLIGGDYPLDPEIDVRRGGGRKCDSPGMPPCPPK